MIAREIKPGIFAIPSVHWERRLFDALIPVPQGTSYNAYLVKGSEGTALIDTTDPALASHLLSELTAVDSLDYVVSNHTEQDHSGLIPEVLARYPKAKLLCSSKARDLLIAHLHVDATRIEVVQDGESRSLGDKSLQFIYTPWVHWPETMCTLVPESKVLFSCDFFGSHQATSSLFVPDREETRRFAQRYFAELMLPFRTMVQSNLKKLSGYSFDTIAPSHGPVYNDCQWIIDAYQGWASPKRQNRVCLPYVSMHGSTLAMVQRLIDSLAIRHVAVDAFDLTVADLGDIAMSLVDSATLVLATPTVHVGPHPAAAYAATIANMVRPQVKYAAIMGSYGWATKVVEQVTALMPNIKATVLATILQKGLPTAETFAQIDALAEAIATAHQNDADVL